MSRKSLDLAAARQVFEEFADFPDRVPVRFTYRGREYAGFSPDGAGVTRGETEQALTLRMEQRIDDTMTAVLEASFDREYGEIEYTLRFRNPADHPSGVLEEVRALDRTFSGEAPVLRGNLGDHENFYAAYEHDLTRSDRYFRSEEGRATHVVFPYFDLSFRDHGVMIALGWAGTWETLFNRRPSGEVRVRARTDVTLKTVLLPGEKVRTGQVVLLPYRGNDRDDAANLWREWFIARILPRRNAAGDPLKPISLVCFASDTGLPNSDGSISERSFTWQPTLNKMKEEHVLPDFRWFDAGWYCAPDRSSVESDWWGTVGSWEPDPVKWPGDSLLVSNEACHREGMKTLCWFEPERVTHVEDLAKNFGYREEWSIGTGEVRTNDLGDPDCLAWTLERITKMMGENGFDLYREDNNSSPAHDWPYKDRIEAERCGLPRGGITENKCICGHYALWDGIISWCAAHGKCTFVDSCASGGGRNDIESLRRSVPLLRSDYDRTTSAMRLSQSSTFLRWIPFCGSSTKETVGQLDEETGGGSRPYVTRASLLPAWNYGGMFTHDPELDFGRMRKALEEWRSVGDLLLKDFYVLTPWHHHLDREGWTVFAYDDPEAGKSVLLAFRMEECKEAEQRFCLPFACSGKTYLLKDEDTGLEQTMTGEELLDGITIRLAEPGSCAMLRIRRN